MHNNTSLSLEWRRNSALLHVTVNCAAPLLGGSVTSRLTTPPLLMRVAPQPRGTQPALTEGQPADSQERGFRCRVRIAN